VFGGRRFVAVLVASLAAAAALGGGDARSDRSAATPGMPLLGVNLIQHDFAPPYCWGGHIIVDYDHPGVRLEVVPPLHAMRAAGLETLRLFVYHSSKTDGVWPIDSSEGRLVEPYRTNLIRFLDDIRKAGFMQVTITFNPWGPNDPIGYTGEPYDPTLFEQNWSFIRDVRTLTQGHGPQRKHFDLLNEGAPAWWQLPRLSDYVTRIYQRYVDAFGNGDVTISSIAKGMWNAGSTWDDVQRLQNLIDALRASGRPLPTWFAVHPSWDARAIDDLRAVDDVLTRNGLAQPLVISESAYESTAVSGAISDFMRTSTRSVREVVTWPLYTDNVSGQGFTVQPRCPTLPFRIDEYAKVLRGGPPPRTLRGSVGPTGQMSLLTAYGDTVKALAAGTYTLTVRDTSARHGFQLAVVAPLGPGFVTRTTGLRFRGTVTWTVKLPAGWYRVAAKGPRTVGREFPVLSPGG
jgi:hypothetical protein